MSKTVLCKMYISLLLSLLRPFYFSTKPEQTKRRRINSEVILYQSHLHNWFRWQEISANTS